jgi:glycosyltransferase involved in cell wall biosynthesis
VEEFSEATKLAQTVNAVRLTRPRVIYAQLDESNIIAGMAGLLCETDRIVLSFRNYNPSYFDFHRGWFKNAYQSLARSRKIVLTGNFSGANEDYAQWIGVPGDRVRTIPNAIDEEIFAPPTSAQLSNLREELALPLGSPIVLGVFRLSKEKRPLDFVRVAERIAGENASVHFLLAGVGPFGGDVRKAIEDSSLASCVHLLGRRSDVNALMAISTLLLHTADLEGMPNVIMEAMHSGLPVVATNAGGTRDLVIDQRTGFMHETGDVEGLAASCLRLFADPELARAMKEAASIEIARRFTPDRMAKQYLSATGLYEQDVKLAEASPALLLSS